MFAGMLGKLGVANYLNFLYNPQVRIERYLKVMAQMRRGGLTPDRIDELLAELNGFADAEINLERIQFVANISKKYGLKDVTEQEMIPVMRQLMKEGEALTETCWHPLAPGECSLENGKPKITKAHSIQNNRILKAIAKDGYTTMFDRLSADFAGVEIHKNIASTFRGMCNKDDGVFEPIDKFPFTNTPQQRFLFAYRSFLYSMHIKHQVSYYTDYGPEWLVDFKANKDIFDHALLTEDWSRVEGGKIQIPNFYPIAASGSFYLEYDFEGKAIPHSDSRMEFIHVDLFPEVNRTIFLISYLKEDAHLYSQLIPQLKARNNYRNDLSALLGGHTENIYFHPDYFSAFMEGQDVAFKRMLRDSQLDHVDIDGDGNWDITSLTPEDYLSNRHGIKLFGY